jgi:glycerol-3-phosphate acyltransferase PlsX
MEETNEFNFVGNVEGRDLFDSSADVIVCDGFTGNVVLKEAEAFFKLISKRGLMDDYFKRFNYENYGGTPVLGINSNVLIGHGISSPRAIKNMIIASKTVTLAELPLKIKQAFN